jgi:hypothetical protein
MKYYVMHAHSKKKNGVYYSCVFLKCNIVRNGIELERL